MTLKPWFPRIWIPICLALFLSACPGFDASARIDLACESAASSVYVLTVLKAQGELSAAQITQVDLAVNVVDPICGTAVRPTTVDALNAVNAALLTLNGVKLGVGG